MTKQEQINEMLLYVPQTIIAYDMNPKGQHLYGEQREYIAKALYDAGYRKTPDDIRELIDVLAEGVKLKEKLDEIKRLEKENACLLKACEEQLTFNTTENHKYSVFNTVRKVFANEVKTKIEELLEEYENDKRRD